jgi:hypothetical protein
MKLLTTRWKDFRILFATMGPREVAPGVTEHTIGFEYQPLVDLSADPPIAARQHAACAAAWRRQTENSTPPDVARGYLERADRHVALAVGVLGASKRPRASPRRRAAAP